MQTITDVLAQIRGGLALAQAGAKLQEVVAAVRATNKPGEITFTIKVTQDKTDDRVVIMKPTIKAKVPEKGFSDGIFFVDANGRLTKEDPAQVEMQLDRQRQGVATLGAARADESSLSKLGSGSTG
jgi:hypothetical protein